MNAPAPAEHRERTVWMEALLTAAVLLFVALGFVLVQCFPKP